MDLYYNPEQMPESEIKDTFVARQWMLEELLSIVRKQRKGAGVQHVMLIGPRGMGKTTMLLMLRFGIMESDLARKWMAVRFPEESYSVTDLADFWISVIAHLSYATNDPKLLAKVDELKKDHSDAVDLANLAMATLKDWSKSNGKRIAILVDNFDLMLAQMRDEDDQARLRDVLMNDGTFMLVGGATSFFKEARGYEEPLYNFFKTYDLTALKEDQVNELLRRRAAADNNAGFEEQVKRNAGRIRVLHYFTGGSPRLVLMLYRIVVSAEIVDVKRGLEKLLDEVTPYYKAKIEILPPQQRKILDNLARVSGKTHEGLTPTQLAQETRLPVNQVSAQLRRLSELGYVAAASVRSKNSYYSLAEPLYAIWHQMRFGRGNRQRLDWLVNFLQGWYSDSEGLEQCGRLAETFQKLVGSDPARMGEALDIRQCFVDALPEEYRGGEIDRLICDSLVVGDAARVRDIVAEIDLPALANETLMRLTAGGFTDSRLTDSAIRDFTNRLQRVCDPLEDVAAVLRELDELKLFFSKYPVLWFARARVLEALGRKRDALLDYEAGLGVVQDERAEILRAYLLLKLCEYAAALEAANVLIAKNASLVLPYHIQIMALELLGRFEDVKATCRIAISASLEEFKAYLDAYEGIQDGPAHTLVAFLILLTLRDYDNAGRIWHDVVHSLTGQNVAVRANNILKVSLAPHTLTYLQGLLKSMSAEEILFPIARAIDYLLSRDRSIIEKLSAEVRPIVEEIVAEYEEKYRPKAEPAPVRRKHRTGVI